MDPRLQRIQTATRRHFLRQCPLSLGALAMTDFMGSGKSMAAMGSSNPLAVKKPNHPAKAKAVIYLHMSGSSATGTV
jgi:hypothetical protein